MAPAQAHDHIDLAPTDSHQERVEARAARFRAAHAVVHILLAFPAWGPAIRSKLFDLRDRILIGVETRA